MLKKEKIFIIEGWNQNIPNISSLRYAEKQHKEFGIIGSKIYENDVFFASNNLLSFKDKGNASVNGDTLSVKVSENGVGVFSLVRYRDDLILYKHNDYDYHLKNIHLMQFIKKEATLNWESAKKFFKKFTRGVENSEYDAHRISSIRHKDKNYPTMISYNIHNREKAALMIVECVVENIFLKTPKLDISRYIMEEKFGRIEDIEEKKIHLLHRTNDGRKILLGDKIFKFNRPKYSLQDGMMNGPHIGDMIKFDITTQNEDGREITNIYQLNITSKRLEMDSLHFKMGVDAVPYEDVPKDEYMNQLLKVFKMIVVSYLELYQMKI